MSLRAIDPFILTPDEPVRAPDPNAASGAQRLRIHVPNIKTTISLGAKAPGGKPRELDTGAPNFAGFGVDTVGHVFVNARGGKPDSKMSLQANGQIVIQTDEDSLYLVSSGPSVMATPASVNVAGGGGVNIAAGWGTDVANPSCDGEAGPGAPDAVASLPGHLSNISDWWSGIDAGMAGLAIAGGVLQARFANPKTGWIAALLTASNLSAVGCIANNVFGLAKANPANGGVTIHGTQGWLLGTPLYGSAYAAAGLTIGSAFPAIMGLVDVGVMSGRAIGIAAGKEITLTAGKDLSILGGKKVEVASRGSGGTAIKGKTIVVGSASGAGGQTATKGVAVFGETVAIAGKKKLILSGKDKASIRGKELSIGGDKVTVSGSNKASIQAKKVGVWGDSNVCLGTSGFFVNVGKSNLKLGNIKKALAAAPAYEPPALADVLEALGTDRPMANLKALKTDAEESHTAKLMAWLDKVAALDHKNCSIELKNGDIKLEVHGFKFKIDSSKTAIANSLKIMK